MRSRSLVTNAAFRGDAKKATAQESMKVANVLEKQAAGDFGGIWGSKSTQRSCRVVASSLGASPGQLGSSHNMRRTLSLITQSCVIALSLMSACSIPTLVEVARRRQAPAGDNNVKDDVRVRYTVTDLDVLNFTDEVKRKLRNRSSFHMGVRYGSAGTQATLGALAGAAKTFGWGVSAASGLGLGATYIFGMGQIFDAKAHAQAYEQAYTAIQAAESSFYFSQTGMHFAKDASGKTIVVLPKTTPESAKTIPYSDRLTPDGQTLYYRATKILKVLADVLASKIPDLQDLKDSTVTSSESTTPPAKPTGAPSAPSPPSSTAKSIAPTHSIASDASDADVGALREWWKPGGVVNQEHAAQFENWLSTHESGVDIATFLNSPLYKNDRPRATAALVQH